MASNARGFVLLTMTIKAEISSLDVWEVLTAAEYLDEKQHDI